MDLEKIHGIPQRIAALKAKLAARDGKAEYKMNCEMLRAEIARLEAVTAKPLASGSDPGTVENGAV